MRNIESIEELSDFLEIIFNLPAIMEDKRAYDSKALSETNNVVKEYMALSGMLAGKGEKEEFLPERAEQFLSNYFEIIYRYALRKNGKEKQKDDARPAFFYRGVSNNTHPLCAGIFRKNEYHGENYYFNEIGVRCPEAFHSLNNLEKLAYMQHYGCPTRLLDITSNPLVALYFASTGDEQKEGSIYIFCVKTDEILYSSSDKVQMLSKFAEFKSGSQDEMMRLARKHMLDDKFPQKSNGHYKNSVLEQYYHAIKRNNGAFEREIVPFDMLKPLFVQPNKDNPRILKQDGAFIISGLDKDDKESDKKLRESVAREIIISPSAKANIRRELECVGINQASLFPEVDRVAEYLRKRH